MKYFIAIFTTVAVTFLGLPAARAQSGPLVPIVSQAAESSHVIKASSGVVWGIVATNLTATPGFLLVLDATSLPADGAVKPLICAPLPANGIASFYYATGPSAQFTSGIIVVASSGASCFTKTTGVITAFFGAMAQ